MQVLSKTIEAFLEDNGITSMSLMNYKEMPSSDGHHMQGWLKINNKKSIYCEDLGIGVN